MSPPNQPYTHYQPSSQNGVNYQPAANYSSNVYQDGQARNPQSPNPTNMYPDPRASGYAQPLPLQSNMGQQAQQDEQPTQEDHNRQHHPVQYISTPPLVSQFHNPNPPPFTTTPRTAVQNASPQPLRYQCDKCGTTFSRLHDRNRHYESTHSDNPPIHKCERCRKQFSRADAKKRHEDDGKCVSSP